MTRPEFHADQLRAILDSLPSLVAFVDADGYNRYANQAAALWLGRTPEQVEGRCLRELLTEEGYAAVQSQIEAALAGEHQVFERTLKQSDGSVVHTLTEYIPRLTGGQPDGFSVLITDISRQVWAEMARESDRRRVEELLSLNRLAAHMSDDVLQELFAIGLHLERMQRFPEEALEGAAPVVESIATTIERLRATIKQLVTDPDVRAFADAGPRSAGRDDDD